MRIAEFDAATDQAVVSPWILSGGMMNADRVRGEVVVRSDEHRLDPDGGALARHVRESSCPVDGDRQGRLPQRPDSRQDRELRDSPGAPNVTHFAA
jgi:hypothetical protein